MSKPAEIGRDLLTQLTPEHALLNLFESDEWPGTADPDKAARIVTQWLADSGFKIVDAEVRMAARPSGLLEKLREWRLQS